MRSQARRLGTRRGQQERMGVYDYLKTRDSHFIRYGIWRKSGPVRGSVILLNGRSEFMEKYAEAVSELQARQFWVYSLDWRGQGLSTRLLGHPYKGYVAAFEDYLQDLADFVQQVVIPDHHPPLYLLAHSMGGHIGLRLLSEHPGLVAQAVLLSPMFDMVTWPFPQNTARWISRCALRLGAGTAYTPVSGDYQPPDGRRFKGNKLSSDLKRFLETGRMVEKLPGLALGGVTYQWVAAAFESVDLLARPGYVERITVPVLMMGAGRDQVVSTAVQKRLCRRMPHCRHHLIAGAMHEILREKTACQQAFWSCFDRFMRKKT